MDTLVARTAYDVDDTGYWHRLPWVIGVFWGVLMLAYALWRGEDLLAALISTAIGAMIFGVLMRVVMKRLIGRLQTKVYNEDPSLVPALTPDEQASFRFRLPCGFVVGPNRIAAGVLYFGPQELRFQAATKGPFRNLPPVSIPLTDDLKVELEVFPLSGVSRLFAVRSPRALTVRTHGNDSRFLVPDAGSTFLRVEQCLAALRAA